MDLINTVTAGQLKTDIPEFKAGDTLRVHTRVIEGEKERIQIFEGVCIRRKGSGIHETFTVHKVSNGVGVERIFPLHSPRIAKIENRKIGRVRRAKLYYLRRLRGKAAQTPPVTGPLRNWPREARCATLPKYQKLTDTNVALIENIV